MMGAARMSRRSLASTSSIGTKSLGALTVVLPVGGLCGMSEGGLGGEVSVVRVVSRVDGGGGEGEDGDVTGDGGGEVTRGDSIVSASVPIVKTEVSD